MPILQEFIKRHFKESIKIYNQELASGVYYLTERVLLDQPIEKWPEHFKDLQANFGYQVTLLKLEDLDIADHHVDELKNGEIAVVEEGDFLFKQIGNSGFVVKSGPLSEIEPEFGYLALVFWAIALVIIALITFLWTLPFLRNVKKIGAGTAAFGRGNLAERINISKRSSLYPVSMSFNSMAKRIEQLINSHKELTNAVSHELRTPLSRLRFSLEMLHRSESLEKQDRYKMELATDIGELEDLVSELLTYARFDREKPEMTFVCASLNAFLKDLLRENNPEGSTIAIELLYNIHPASTPIKYEPKQMARAVGNLVQNALSFSKEKIEVTVLLHHEFCVVHIDDDGPGVAEDKREKIFEPFVRLDGSRSRMTGGYGLGLSIVKRIMQWHKGSAKVNSSPLGGARFTLEWPVQ